MKPVDILHLHSTFMLGGKEARAVQLMNAFGDHARHTILSAVPEALAARDAIDPGIVVDFPTEAPSLIGLPGVARYRRLARYMRRFDLVLSYNWGSMDGLGARRLFGGPPLVHHEDGFNADEAERLNWKRNLFRRVALTAAHALVVPSTRLERVACESWKRQAIRISNGIRVDLYHRPPEPDAIPGLQRAPGDVIVGTIAGLRSVKDLPRLVRAVAAQPRHVKLVIVGEGPERAAIAAEAERCGIADRVLMPGFLDRPWRYAGLFDIFALSSLSEQFPISLVEAMAAGLPTVSTDVGDVMAMVAPANTDFIVPATDESAYAQALERLCADADLRAELGRANRAKAAAAYDERVMIGAYARLYGEALGEPRAFG